MGPTVGTTPEGKSSSYIDRQQRWLAGALQDAEEDDAVSDASPAGWLPWMKPVAKEPTKPGPIQGALMQVRQASFGRRKKPPKAEANGAVPPQQPGPIAGALMQVKQVSFGRRKKPPKANGAAAGGPTWQTCETTSFTL